MGALTRLIAAAFAAAAFVALATTAIAQSTSYSYDALGRLIGVTYGNGASVAYAYDAAGNRTQVSTTGAAPIANPVSVTVSQNASSAAITTNITGAATSVSLASNPSHGTATANGTNFTYTPTVGYFGSDSFTYTATNAGGTSAAAAVTITINPIAPVAHMVYANVYANAVNSLINLNINGGTATTVSVASNPAHGVATASGTSITYTPQNGYLGSDTFTYTASNAVGTSSAATVSINVIIAPPIANQTSVTVPYDSPKVPINFNITGGPASSIQTISHPYHGSIQTQGTTIYYQPTSGYSGSDQFEYQATNTSGSSSGYVSITVLVQPPVSNGQNLSVPGNSTNNTITPYISGGSATSVSVASSPNNGVATASGTTLYYTPTNGYTGSDSFTYTATNAGGTSAPATVAVTVTTPLPIANAVSQSVAENSSNNGITLVITGGTATSVSVATSPSHGTARSLGGQTNTILYTPAHNYSGLDSFTYTASNNSGTSASATVSITVNPPPPTANNSNVNVAYQTSGNLVPLIFTQGPGGATSLALVSGPSQGSATVNGLNINYTPANGFSGTDSLTYTASNGGGTSAAATVTIHVQPLAIPTAQAVSASVVAGTTNNPITLIVTGTYTSVAVVSQPSSGTATASGTTISYTPGAQGSFTFPYTASNAAGTSAAATVTVTVTGSTPVAGNVSASVAYNSSGNVIQPNASGAAATSLAITTGPGHGTATASGTTISYTPTSGYVGADTLTYTLSNSAGTSSAATVSISVGAPVAAAVNATVAYGSSSDPISLNLSGGPATSVAVASSPSHGTATASGAAITYSPTSGYSGTDSFTYTATNAGGTSSAATVTISVGAQSPIAGGASLTVAYGSSGNAVPLSLSGGTATAVQVATNPSHGTASASGTSITYAPAVGYFGPDSFTYTASNSSGTSSAATISITVNPQAPVANNVSASVAYNSSSDAIPLNVTGGAATSVAVATAPGHGTATASGTSITYTPTSGYSGTDSFTYTATNAGGTSSAATVTISVGAQSPIAGGASLTVAYGSSGNAVPLSLSGGTATAVQVASNPSHGTASASGTSITYAPAAGYSGPDSFTYTASNSSGTSSAATISITVNPQAPVANNVSASVAYNSSSDAIPLNVTGGAATSVAVATAPGHGTATASGTSITYTPTSGYSGTDSFTYTATNAGGTSTAATASIMVSAQAPVANQTNVTVAYNSSSNPITLNITGGVPTGVAIARAPSEGTATVNGLTIYYTPNTSFSGTDTLTYSATNATGSSAASVVITVLGQPPIAGNVSATVGYNSSGNAIALNLTGGTATSVAVASNPSHGSATASGTSISYTPNSSFSGNDSFTYTATNVNGTSSAATVTITVTQQAPIAGAVGLTVAFDSSGNAVPLSLSGGTATSVHVTTNPSHGSATASGTSITYSPANAYSGPDSFTYTASNATGTSSAATISITVNPQAPAAYSVSAAVVANSSANPIGLTLTGGTPTSVAVVTSPSHGSTSVSGTTISYTPQASFVGTDSFTYTASNAGGTSSAATVTVTVSSQAPVANQTNVTIAANSSGNPIIPNITGGAAASVGIARAPSSGAASVSGTTIYYTPNAGFSGTDSLTYSATNASGASAASVVITVLSQAPVANNVTSAIALNSSSDAISLSLTGGAATSVAVVSGPSHGTASASGTSIIYTPASGYSGPDSFTYDASNVVGTSAPATVSITVSSSAPSVSSFSTSVAFGATNSAIPLQISGSNITGVTITSTTNGTATTSGSGTSTQAIFTPTKPFTGQASFTYTATNSGGTSNTGTVSITVGPAPNPVANLQTFTVKQSLGTTFNPITGSPVVPPANPDTDPNGLTLTVTAIGTPSYGTLTPNGTNAYMYQPNVSSGTDVFSYTISNGYGGTATSTITMQISAGKGTGNN